MMSDSLKNQAWKDRARTRIKMVIIGAYCRGLLERARRAVGGALRWR